MLTLKEIIDFVGIERSQLEAIARLEHIPEVVAAEMVHELIRTPHGIVRLHQLFLDAIEAVEDKVSLDREGQLLHLYMDFSQRFPMPRML